MKQKITYEMLTDDIKKYPNDSNPRRAARLGVRVLAIWKAFKRFGLPTVIPSRYIFFTDSQLLEDYSKYPKSIHRERCERLGGTVQTMSYRSKKLGLKKEKQHGVHIKKENPTC